MSAYPLPTKAQRKLELIRELKRYTAMTDVSVEFINRWLGAALYYASERDQRATAVLKLYYGLSNDFSAYRLGPIARMFKLSIPYISKIRGDGVQLLCCGLSQIYKRRGDEEKVVPITQVRPVTPTENLLLTEFLLDHYVRSKIEERCPKIAANSARGALLRNANYRRRVLKWLPQLLEKHLGRPATVSDLLALSPDDIRAIGKRRLGAPSVEWVEEYLHLFNFVLPNSRTTYGITAARQELLKAV